MMKESLTIIEDTTLEPRFSLTAFLKSGRIHLSDFYNQIKDTSSSKHYLDLVSHITGIAKEIIVSPSRRRDHVVARKLFMVLAYRLTDESLEYIGMLANRDHATAVHSLNTLPMDYNDYREQYKFTRDWVQKASDATGISVAEILSPPDRMLKATLKSMGSGV